MDVETGGFRSRLGSVQVFFLSIFLLSVGSVHATSGIARQVTNSCSPAMTMPDVGSCSACHSTTNESNNDLNAAGMQARAGNFAFFCPPVTPNPGTGTGGTDTGTNTGTGTAAMGSGMTGMRGSRRSGMRGSMRGSGHRSHRHRHHHDDDDDNDDDDDDDDDRDNDGDDDRDDD